ncbi:branched-chain amino acid transport system substrate-binding protein [Desulfacinum hydrothermale DSM 13146]|uniref:Branched-chain amino acid transport system substrate-binding protein n=1 Tax=Desulfacinum hydrothermale DSM 13146 TaxID=1121390 RepID=A0A1W1XN34_9BACT|nr:ABC transporter substrate-binding protein [Desulfacinum hydrothermale]SMC25282.1 branched-chain amino acid transport system substrate-binding protein [Desulfacinum hydrothermale DSM 13146]
MMKRFSMGLAWCAALMLIAGGWLVPSPAAAVKEVKIGVIYPLTGGAAAAGRELRAGAELAAQIANEVMDGIDMDMAKKAGIQSLGGAKIKLIFKDHEGNPTLGADLAKKLILDDKVDGILGCYHSSVTKTVSAVCEQYGVPMINGSSTSPALTKRGFKWFWRTTPHDKWFTKDLFELLDGLAAGKVRGVSGVKKDDLQRLAAACERTEWGAHVADLIKTLAEQYGYDLKKSILYAAKSADLSSEVRSLKAARPDVMLFASYTSDAILMVKTLKAQKAKPKLIWGQDAGFEKPEFRQTLGDNIVGILTRTVFLPKVADIKPVAGQVNQLYKAKTGHDLGGASARAFTGVQTWVYALEKAGSVDHAAIQKACNTIEIPGEQLVVPWAGIKFASTGDETGQNVLGSGLIGQYQKGKDGKIGLEIVYPFDLATADMIYPFPGW